MYVRSIVLNMIENFKETVLAQYENRDWQGVLSTLYNEGNNSKYVLWIRPDESDLKFISDAVVCRGNKLLISIGCGCGILEWLIQIATELPVYGIEVNQEWWMSKYVAKTFIPLIFTDDPECSSLLNQSNSVLLFCYFNNRQAFSDYLKHYKGNCIIIIGPGKNKGVHTDPEPFEVKFNCPEWHLTDYKEIRDTQDFIAIYVK